VAVGAGVVGAGAGVVAVGFGVVGAGAGVVAVGFGVVGAGVGVAFVGVGVGFVGVGVGLGFAASVAVAGAVGVTGVPVAVVTFAVFVAALIAVVTALTSRVPSLRSTAAATYCLCTMKRAASRHFASPIWYEAAPDGGMGARSAPTTSADSFCAAAAFGRAGIRAISRPIVSSARPPGPASHAGPAGVTDGWTAADDWVAPVMLATRTAPPRIAAAPRDVRCFLKVLLLALSRIGHERAN
jgi:hypothetical protein